MPYGSSNLDFYLFHYTALFFVGVSFEQHLFPDPPLHPLHPSEDTLEEEEMAEDYDMMEGEGKEAQDSYFDHNHNASPPSPGKRLRRGRSLKVLKVYPVWRRSVKTSSQIWNKPNIF
jgi:hypothetical protein